MRNFNRLQCDERGSTTAAVAGYFFGFAIGALLWGTIEYHNGFANGENSKTHQTDNEKQIQIQNEQITGQLDTQFPELNTLLLNAQDGSLSFKTITAQKVAENCTGTYTDNGGVAKVVGQLTCAQSVPLKS